MDGTGAGGGVGTLGRSGNGEEIGVFEVPFSFSPRRINALATFGRNLPTKPKFSTSATPPNTNAAMRNPVAMSCKTPCRAPEESSGCQVTFALGNSGRVLTRAGHDRPVLTGLYLGRRVDRALLRMGTRKIPQFFDCPGRQRLFLALLGNPGLTALLEPVTNSITAIGAGVKEPQTSGFFGSVGPDHVALSSIRSSGCGEITILLEPS